MKFPFKVAVWSGSEYEMIATAISHVPGKLLIVTNDGAMWEMDVDNCRMITKLEEHLAGE